MVFHSESGGPTALTGNEDFTEAGTPLPFRVLDFWQWSESDLQGAMGPLNIPQFLVAAAVGATDTPIDRNLPYTLRDPRGLAIQVCQSHGGENVSHSRRQEPIVFSPYRHDARGARLAPERGDSAVHDGVHVLAQLVAVYGTALRALELSNWAFYVVPTRYVDERWPGKNSLGLEELRASPYGIRHSWAALSAAIGAYNVGPCEACKDVPPLPLGVDRGSISGRPCGEPTRREKKNLTGGERFTNSGDPLPVSVVDYWRWGSANLVAGSLRRRLASFLVAKAIGPLHVSGDPETECDVWDAGWRPITVRSQVLPAPRDEVDPESVELWCRPTKEWHDFPGSEPIRRAHIYVFALLTSKGGGTLNPLELSQWLFYVVPTGFLDEHWFASESIRLADLQGSPYGEPVPYRALADALAERARHYPVGPARSPTESKAIETDAVLLLAHADALGLDFRTESLRGWNHMGALCVDAVLAFDGPLLRDVRPRVVKVKRSWPDAVSTSGFLARLDSVDLAEFVDIDDEPLPQQIRKLAQRFRELDIETIEDLRRSLTNPESRNEVAAALSRDSRPYLTAVVLLEKLVGLTGSVSTGELRAFTDEAGIVHHSVPHHLANVARAAAASRGVPVENVYSAIWAYDGLPKP